MSTRALLRALAVTLALLTISGVAAPAANATGTPTAKLTMAGDVELLPGLDFFHVDMHARQPAGGPTTGSFAGAGELRGTGFTIPIPLSLAGPVTCLTVHGATAAFLYPVAEVNPPLLSGLLQGATSVLFTVTKGANGAPDRVGFVGPLPSQFFRGCQPTGTPFVFHGTVRIA